MPESWLVAKVGDADVSGQAKVVSLFPKRCRVPITDVFGVGAMFCCVYQALS